MRNPSTNNNRKRRFFMIANKDIQMLKEKHDVAGLDRIMMRGHGIKQTEAAIALVELDDPTVVDDVWDYAMEDPDHHHDSEFIVVLGKSPNPVYHELMETLLNKAYRNTHKTR
jgi:hypothetical protein